MASYISMGDDTGLNTKSQYEKTIASLHSRAKVYADPEKSKNSMYAMYGRRKNRQSPYVVSDDRVQMAVSDLIRNVDRQVKNASEIISKPGWENDPNNIKALVQNLANLEGQFRFVEEVAVTPQKIPPELIEPFNDAIAKYEQLLKESFVEQVFTMARKKQMIFDSIRESQSITVPEQESKKGSVLLPVAAAAAALYFAMK